MRFAAVLIISATTLGAYADTPGGDREVAAIVDEAAGLSIDEGLTQGLVVVIAKHGSIILERGYGRASIRGNVPMDAEAELDYFSIGKHITAAILLRLAERNELDLDSSANDILPEADFEGAEVTARQLLSHTSGLWEVEKDENDLPPKFGRRPPDGGVLEWANQGGRLASPGETWMYSNAGYLFAGEIAERLTAKTFESLIVEEFARPLGLESFQGCADTGKDRAAGFSFADGETRLVANVHPEWWGGSGTVCGTGSDLVRWWLALRSGQVLNPSSVQQMFRPSRLQRNGSETLFGYGLGVRIGEFMGHSKVGHTGSGSGGTAVLAEYPDEQLVILVIVNTAGSGVITASEIEAEIASALLGERKLESANIRNADHVLATAPGLYRSPLGDICVSARGSKLYRSLGNSEPELMRHIGEGKFATEQGSSSVGVEYFLGMEGGPPQWFGFDYNGFPQDLAVRIGDDCG